MNIHHAVCIDDEFMNKVKNGDPEARELLIEVYKARVETGEPYIFFTDNVNKANPQCYKERGLDVKTSNICSEITLFTDTQHSFVCCLSSLNLVNWDKITDDDIFYSVVFLDGVLSEYIEKAHNVRGLESAVRSAEKGRALGLGVLGYHSLLQSEGTAFNSFRAKLVNKAIFDKIRRNADRATEYLAKEYGEPEWCVGSGRRNTHTIAVAPTASNSIIAGSVSQGIEPLAANAFAKKTAKGTFISYNPYLKKLLTELGKDTPDVWTNIATNGGSVQHLDFLDEEQKKVFLTAYEIDQLAIIDQAADRQVFIDQAQSLNLFFYADTDSRYFHAVHFAAWEKGVKTLYYCRTSTVIKGDVASRNETECLACHG
jgi:ribonucleoside-diphosphate reductase alpha chain